MQTIFNGHYKCIEYCDVFVAPDARVTPVIVPANTELLEIITGGVIYSDMAEGHSFRRGSIFWHQGGDYTIYKTSPSDPYRCLCLSFQTDGSPRPFPAFGKWGYAPEFRSFVENMLYFASHDRLGEPGVLAYALGSLLCQMQGRDNIDIPRAVRIACRIMDNNTTADISINELAKKSGVSRSRLFALFHEHLKISPHQYLLRRRIASAKNLIARRPEMPFKLISESCGFNNIEIFYRQFYNHTGLTPGDFRKQCADNDTA